jgi:hypothetical protein
MDFFLSADKGWGLILSTLPVIILKAGHDSINTVHQWRYFHG